LTWVGTRKGTPVVIYGQVAVSLCRPLSRLLESESHEASCRPPAHCQGFGYQYGQVGCLADPRCLQRTSGLASGPPWYKGSKAAKILCAFGACIFYRL
jgi:hypothetical protein